MKQSKYLILAFLLWAGVSYGQETAGAMPEVHNLLPPSPEMASLGKYGAIPVGHHTGIPSINIPLGAVSGRELSTAISLNYHASGIKVEAKAESAGQGWTLSGGGQITRTVRGLPDEMNSGGKQGYLLSRNLIPTDNGDYANWYNDCNNYVLMQQIANNTIDGQPDLFSFSAPGLSGQFFFGADGNIHLVPNQPLKVSNTGSFSSFTITNEVGVKYTFSLVSHTSSTSDMGDMLDYSNYKSTWHLTKMENAKGTEHIDFEYETYKTETILYSESKSDCFTNDPDCLSNTSQQITYGATYLVYNDARRIKEIKSLKNKVVFNYASRLDNINAEEDQRLASINIYDTPEATTPNRTFNLIHSYFGNNIRLKLDEIQQLAGSETMPSYYFSYSDFNVSRDSKAQDYWGFYNGKDNNNQLIPAMSQMPPLVLDGADRTADPAFSIKGMLTSITYPTGGKTGFEYEGHDYHHLPFKYPNHEPFSYANLTYEIFEAEAECPNNICPAPTVNTTTFSPVISGNYAVSYTIRWEDIDCNNRLIGMDNIPAYVKVYRQSNGSTILHKQTDANDYDPSMEGRLLVNGLETFYFEQGVTYVLEASSPYKCIEANIKADIATGGESFETNPSNPNEIFVSLLGGPRIKSITNYDKDNSFTGKKEYIYRRADARNVSSGELISIPRHGYSQSMIINASTEGPGLGQRKPKEIAFFNRSSSSVSYTSSIEGSHVVYSQVIEREVDRNGVPNGETVYKYNIANKQSSHFFPFSPVENREWEDGFLSYVGYFKHEGENLIPVKETEYLYQQVGELYRSPSLVIRTKADPLEFTCGPTTDLRSVFGDSYFYTLAGNKSQLLVTEKVYDNTGENSTVVSSTYDEYDPQTLLLIRSESTGRLDGEKIINRKRYVSDFRFCDAAYMACLETRSACISEKKDVYYDAIRQAELDYIAAIGQYSSYANCFDQTGDSDLCSGIFNDAQNAYENAINFAYQTLILGIEFCQIANTDCSTICEPINVNEYNSSDNEVKAILDLKAANVLYPAIEEWTVVENADGTITLGGAVYRRMNGTHLKTEEIFTVDSKSLNDGFAFTGLEKVGGINKLIKNDDYNSEGILYYDGFTSLVTGSTTKNDIHQSIFWDEDKLRPIAKISNALPNHFWHTSFEGDNGNVISNKWTGNKAANGPTIDLHTLVDGDYVLTFWRWNNNDSQWELQEQQISLNPSNRQINLPGIVDEVRVFPQGALMTTTAYDEAGRVVTECDINGHVIRYEYDAFGRLLIVRDEDGNILKAYKYQFGN